MAYKVLKLDKKNFQIYKKSFNNIKLILLYKKKSFNKNYK